MRNELLRRAEELSRDWNYGNAVHEGHRILGHLELDAAGQTRAKNAITPLGGSGAPTIYVSQASGSARVMPPGGEEP